MADIDTKPQGQDLEAINFFLAPVPPPNANFGDDPTKPSGIHGKPLINFDPAWVCLIYLRLSSSPALGMEILRIHYKVKTDATSKPELADVQTSIEAWINYLNGLTLLPNDTPKSPAPTPVKIPENGKFTGAGAPAFENKYWTGLTNFAFSEQHHVVIYICNKGVSLYDPPVSFTHKMLGSVMGTGPVSFGNYSFYEAKAWQSGQITNGYPQEFLHMKNYYQLYDGSQYRAIRNGATPERVGYSLNINARLASVYQDGGASDVPIIIDPDTGNMGEGQP